MTRFSDQLFDDLMREHGRVLAHTTPPAPRGPRVTARRALLAGGGALAAAGVIAGTLVAGSGTPATHAAGNGTPAYAVTNNPDGTITLAVYKKSGFAGVNARLHKLGDNQVVVVPIEQGCPRPPAPVVPGPGHLISTGITVSPNGSVIVKAHGIPAGDILVVGIERSGHGSLSVAELTSPPAPGCISAPASPPGNGGSGSGSGSGA
jgi:hypothetical protein